MNNPTTDDIERILLEMQGARVDDIANAIYASVVPKIADRIEPEIRRRVRAQMVESGWKEPTDLTMLTRTALIEVAVAEMTKKLIEFPSTQYTEDNVGNLCESLKALEISKRIDDADKERKND